MGDLDLTQVYTLELSDESSLEASIVFGRLFSIKTLKIHAECHAETGQILMRLFARYGAIFPCLENLLFVGFNHDSLPHRIAIESIISKCGMCTSEHLNILYQKPMVSEAAME
jgi:hypothetical protein